MDNLTGREYASSDYAHRSFTTTYPKSLLPNLMSIPSLIKHISRPNRLLCHRKGEEVDRNQVGLTRQNYSMSSENQTIIPFSIIHGSWRKGENVLLGAT